MRELQGQWNYQSYCAKSGNRASAPPVPAMIAAPWAPPAVMDYSTDSSGAITGTASSSGLTFEIQGSITPAATGTPEGIELTVNVAQTGTVYKLRGFFLPDSDHIVGTVVAISRDLAQQPDGTSGPFVLYPVKA